MLNNEVLLMKFKGAEKMTSSAAIKWAARKNKWAPATAEKYYYAWKKIYMHGANCVPQEIRRSIENTTEESTCKGTISEKEGNKPMEINNDVMSGPDAKELFDKEEKEILNQLCGPEEMPFKEMNVKFKGNNGAYTITKDGFKLEENGMKLNFSDVEEWNEFKNEIDIAFKYVEKVGGLI